MATRRTSLSTLALLLAVGLPAAPARAQIRAPSMVEEGEEQAEEAPPRERPEPDERPAHEPPPRGAAPPGPLHLPPPTSPRAQDLPPPPPPPTASRDLARQIVPVKATWAELVRLWGQRRAALREQDAARAAAAERRVLEVKKELDIENLFVHAESEVRESRRALEANLPGEALAHAELATRLASDLPDAHLSLSRARLAVAPREVGAVLSAALEALRAAAREPHTRRAFVGDLASAALAALFTGSVATILLLFTRRLRLFLHDFHHLPLLRGTAPVQTGFLALVLLALPLAFGLGPVAALSVAVLATWLYLSLAERLVATVALAVLVSLPYAAGGAARLAAWTGSPADVVYQLEQGAVSDEEAAEIGARAAQGAAPAPLLAALGRHAKRRGDLDGALRWYRLADPERRLPDVQVNVGNVLFLQGDLDGAKAAYLSATDRAGGDLTTLAAAHYDLSKLYLRTADVERSAAALDRAQQEDGDFIRRHADDDFSANGYLADVPVPQARVAALATSDGSPEAVREFVVARLAGALPRDAWPLAPVAFVALLWALAFAARRAALAHPCDKCGRAACARCDGTSGALCGQCVNVYQKKGVVDARDRLRKEAQVRRHERFERAATRVLAVVGGGAGHVYGGAPGRGFAFMLVLLFVGFVAWFWRGIVPPPQPSRYVLAGKLIISLPVGIALYTLAVRDAFRRSER